MANDRKQRQFIFIKIIVSAIVIFLALYRPARVVTLYRIVRGNRDAPVLIDTPKNQAATVKDRSMSKRFEPRINTYGNYLTVDLMGASGAWLYLTTDLKFVVDSPEAKTQFYAHIDSMRKARLPVSLSAPRPDFKTTFRQVNLDSITNIEITNSNGDIAVSPGSLYSYHSMNSLVTGKNISVAARYLSLGAGHATHSTVSASVNIFSIYSDTLTGVRIINPDTLSISSSVLDSCHLQARYIEMYDTRINSSCRLELSGSARLTKLSGTGRITLVSYSNLSEEMEMTLDAYRRRYGSIDRIYDRSKPVKVTLSNVDLAQLDFDPKKILILVDTTSNNPMADEMYTSLINRFRNDEKERRIYDVQYHHYLRHTNSSFWFKAKDWLWEQWDDYGYDKDNIFQILWRALLFFFAVNYLFFSYLMQDGYSVSNFYSTYNRTKRYKMPVRLLTDAYLSAIYTLLLFWIFRIELDKLKVDKPVFVWIVLQHIASLILLTFAVRALIFPS